MGKRCLSFLEALPPIKYGLRLQGTKRLDFVEGGNSRKDLSFQKFEGGTSSGGDVAHVCGTSGLFGGGDRVSSSDDGDGTVFLGDVGKDVDKVEGSGGELLDLEDSHRSVHDDGLGGGKGFLLGLGGFRSVVKSHPSVRDGISRDNLAVGIGGEFVGDNNVGRKKDGLAHLFGLGHDSLGGVNEVVFDKRSTDLKSLGLQEGENHTSSNDDSVALVKKGFQDGDLGGDLGSSNDGNHRLFSVGDGSVKVFEFLGQKESRDRWLQELGDSLGRGVGTVGSSESIVDEKVERSGELFDESGLVLGLFLVESSVLKHDDITFAGAINNLGNFVSDAVRGKSDILSEELGHALGARSKGELVFLSVRASQVGADSDDGTLSLQELDGWDTGSDTGIIGDGLSVKRNVDIATDQDLLSLKLIIGEIFDGLLGFEGGVDSSEGTCIDNFSFGWIDR